MDKYFLAINLNDFLYLFERIYNNDERKAGVLSIEEQEKIEKQRLLEVLSIVTLNNGCWHNYLEHYSMNPSIHRPIKLSINNYLYQTISQHIQLCQPNNQPTSRPAHQ